MHATIKVKKLWKIGNCPLIFDRLIRKKLKELKDRYQDAVHRKGKTLEVEATAFSASLGTATFNVAMPAWREEVEADILLTPEEKKEKIEVLQDYIGPGASR